MKPIGLLLLSIISLLAGCSSTETQKPLPAVVTPTATQAPVIEPVITPVQTSSVSASTIDSSANRSAPPPVEPAKVIAAPSKGSIYFDFNSHEIDPQFMPVIEEHAKYLRANPAVKVHVEGNTDERGSREYNLSLGQRRAEAVLKALSAYGVPVSRMDAVSLGKEKPRRIGHNETAWSENRRSDLSLGAGR
jgi:peptidoglycan-associated lipoprotein